MTEQNYKDAYLRQKKARVLAEQLLETRSRELYDANQTLIDAYKKLKDQKIQLLQREKLASIGQLSAGVAHEINNPAGYVKSNLNTLTRYLSNFNAFYVAILDKYKDVPDVLDSILEISKLHDMEYALEDITELVSDSLEGMERVANIVQSLKDFARPDTEKPIQYKLNDTIENTIKLVKNQIKYNAEIICHYGEIPLLWGQPGSLSQVFMNLIINASHAMSDKGTITITTTHNASEVIISIEDTGKGIPEEQLSRIFDPFFTTKEIGDGTGLGLSIAAGIIKNQNGQIEVFSTEGVGTRFDIYLPITAGEENR